MAKKSKSSSDGNGCLFAVAAVGLVLFAAAAPITLAVGGVFIGRGCRAGLAKLSGTGADFWLSASEKKKFVAAMEKRNQTAKIIKQAEARVRSEEIKLNKDGSISRRSKAGRELREIIYSGKCS